MGILKRVTRLVQADMHGLLDVLEDPREILKQSMREMEEELVKQEAEQRLLMERERAAEKQQKEGERQLLSIAGEIKLCLEAKNEALAKAAVRRKLETERSLARLSAIQDSLKRQREEHARRLQEARGCYDSLKDKVALFPEHDPITPGAALSPEQPVSDSEVEIALLKEQAALRTSEPSTSEVNV